MPATKVYSTMETRYSTVGRKNISISARTTNSGNIPSKSNKAKENLNKLFNN